MGFEPTSPDYRRSSWATTAIDDVVLDVFDDVGIAVYANTANVGDIAVFVNTANVGNITACANTAVAVDIAVHVNTADVVDVYH